MRGTMQYKAPEHFIDDSDDDSDNDSNDNETKVSPKSTYDKSADVYSFGIMCWVIHYPKQIFFAIRINGNFTEKGSWYSTGRGYTWIVGN